MEKSSAMPLSFFLISKNQLQRSSMDNHIKYCLRAAVLTHDPIRDLLFSPLTPNLRMELEAQIRQAILKNEPRVAMEQVQIEQDLQDPSKAKVQIGYQILETRRRDYVQFQL